MTVPAIIVTDHDRDYLEMMRNILEEEGYPRVFAVVAEEAWTTVLRQEPIGLVLIDLRLSDPDTGWLLLEKLRLHAPTAAVPVILCSTDQRMLTEKATHLAQLNCAILEKPFLIGALLDLVEQLIGPPPLLERSA